MPPPERRQFRTLYRLSLARLLDLEIISSRGDVQGLFARMGGILFSLSLMMAVMIVAPYRTHPFGGATPRVRNDEEFLISITLAAAGLLSVLAWNNLLPDRRDCLVIGLLPVRIRTMASSRLAAIAVCIGVTVLIVNAFTGLGFPYVIARGQAPVVISFAGWWVTVFAAGIFALSWTLAIQGIASQLLRWHAFLRVSAILQMVSLAAVLGLFFLTPPFAQTWRDYPQMASFLPSYWFTGLLNLLVGTRDPALRELGATCIRNLGVAIGIALGTYMLSWWRGVRRIVESPDIGSGRGRTWLAVCGDRLAKSGLTHPLDRAIVSFVARTAARSPQHRLLLAAYAGIGFALSIAFCRVLFGNSPAVRWDQPNAPLLVVGILLITSSVIAARSVFALPHSLRANWVFRITAVQSPAAYFAAMRKSLIVLAALPVWIVCGCFYLAIWPGRFAIEALLVLVLLGLILTDSALYQFRKLPFACSWLPASGQALNTVRAMAYGIGLLIFASALGRFEFWTIRNPGRFVVLCAGLAIWALWLRNRGRKFAASPAYAVQFDDQPRPEIFALDLRPDGEWSSEQAWVDTIEVRPSLARRLRPVGQFLLMAMVTGFVYEQMSEWRDQRKVPQAGRSFAAGGRLLNLSCEGNGPVVVMDSAAGVPGYNWVLVQREVATFARACWYDRAGYGWSDPASTRRTSGDIAEDLHQLLHAAGVPPPYILVGHSFGGLNVRAFASRYREETAGLVLVDPASENEEGEIELPKKFRSPLNRIPRPLWQPFAKMCSFLVHDGLARLMDDGPGERPVRMPERDWAVLHELALQPKLFDAVLAEALSREESTAEVRRAGALGGVPLVVLTAGRPFARDPDPEQERLLESYFHYRVSVDQPRLLRLSTHSRQVVLESGHGIPFEAPEAVVDAVEDEIGMIRQSSR